MKLLLIPCIVLLFGEVLNAQSPCSTFKNGNFIISDSLHGDYHIERRGKKQIELAKQSGMRIKFKVRWINECSYTLTVKKILDNPNQLEFPKDATITVHITDTSARGYHQKVTSNFSDFVLECAVTRQ